MKAKLIKILSFFTSVAMIFSVAAITPVSAATESQIRSEIKRLQEKQSEQQQKINALKKDASKQNELKTAIEQKMALVQQEIDACNRQITSINSKIAANKAEIEKKNTEIENNKTAFKKRLRAIYMSNTGSQVQVLLGADDFSQFLELSQLTASVSAKDKKMIEQIVAAVKVLEEKQKENNKLLENQMAVKKTITQKQQELKTQSDEIQAVISKINSDTKSAQADKNATDAALKDKQETLNEILRGSTGGGGSGGNVVYDGGPFLWPTTTTRISSPWGERWGRMHQGVDISNGRYGLPIYAIADGTVYKAVSGCPHNYPKNSSCGCGGGYGNHVAIYHGKGADGNEYAAYYAHMSSLAVSLGSHVKRGQIIGYVGCTGFSTGPHLHFGIMVNGAFVNPMKFYTKVK